MDRRDQVRSLLEQYARELMELACEYDGRPYADFPRLKEYIIERRGLDEIRECLTYPLQKA